MDDLSAVADAGRVRGASGTAPGGRGGARPVARPGTPAAEPAAGAPTA
jgi:hypothetical protein